MWLFPYEGGYVESSARHPEQLVVPAPPEFQEACRRAGGRNVYGDPLYRLVVPSSRFQIAGGLEVSFYDEHGNYHKEVELEESLIPRYDVPAAYLHGYLLEMWRPAAWFVAQGFGENREFIFSPTGKQIRQLEPAWSRGGYEAVNYEGDVPWCFTNRISSQVYQGREYIMPAVVPATIEKAIRRHQQSLFISHSRRMLLVREQADQEERRNQQAIRDRIREQMSPFALAPHIGYGPKHRDLA